MEEWMRWEPLEGLSGRFVIESLKMSYVDLTIQLSAEDSDIKIEIIFDGSIDAYRCTNESFCFSIFSYLSKQYGDNFYNKWSFFKIVNSEYAESVSKKSVGLTDFFSFRHFCIIGDDEVIDVLANYEPTVRIIKQ